jgi:hypothetical protein
VLQADEGCDFDFLLREGGAELKSGTRAKTSVDREAAQSAKAIRAD